jgi:hypothetical protein
VITSPPGRCPTTFRTHVRAHHEERQYGESGAIYQPVYIGKRGDIPAGECGVDRLKHKAEV